MLLDALEEGHVECWIIRTLLRMDDDLRLWADFSASLRGILQRLAQRVPSIIAVVAPVVLRFRTYLATVPQHAKADFVAYLNQIRCGASFREGFQRFLGVVVDVFISGSVHHLEDHGRVLLLGVSPSVAVMEIEHEVEPGVLDALAE